MSEQQLEKLKPYLRHKHNCTFHQCQQYSDGLDGQPVDCSCGLVKQWNKQKAAVKDGE